VRVQLSFLTEEFLGAPVTVHKLHTSLHRKLRIQSLRLYLVILLWPSNTVSNISDGQGSKVALSRYAAVLHSFIMGPGPYQHCSFRIKHPIQPLDTARAGQKLSLPIYITLSIPGDSIRTSMLCFDATPTHLEISIDG